MAMEIFDEPNEINTTLDSKSSSGDQGLWDDVDPSISANGQYVTFPSLSVNLTPNDTNMSYDVYWHDRLSGENLIVSKALNGSIGNDASLNASISADGNSIAFGSRATNLVDNDLNELGDVFFYGIPYMFVSTNSLEIEENIHNLELTIILEAPPVITTSVDVSTKDGTAISNFDYVPVNLTVQFEPGERVNQYIYLF